jgi:hypothetical protein
MGKLIKSYSMAALIGRRIPQASQAKIKMAEQGPHRLAGPSVPYPFTLAIPLPVLPVFRPSQRGSG